MKGELVYIESPYAASESGTVEDHVEYAKLCMLDCIGRGEYPFASHLMYPQLLDDLLPGERKSGMKSGDIWSVYADVRAVYIDQGHSSGMEWGVNRAFKLGQRVEYRSLYEEENDREKG